MKKLTDIVTATVTADKGRFTAWEFGRGLTTHRKIRMLRNITKNSGQESVEIIWHDLRFGT